MDDGSSRIEEIMRHVPAEVRVVAETIRTCATSEFTDRWPEAADDMAAVVCGRWLHATGARGKGTDISYIDRLVNESFSTLDDDQIAATERMFEELSGSWGEK